MFEFLKPKKPDTEIKSILPQEVYDSGTLELRDVIAPSALKVTPKSVNLGEKIVRSFFIISYPRYLTDSWFAPIINLDKIFDVSIFISPIETAQILRTFQKKVAEVQSQINTREQKGLVRDPMLDTAYQDLENLRDQLQQAEEKLFDIGLYVTIYGNSDGELDKTESEIKSILESKMVYIKPALFQQEQGFKTTLPLGDDELKVYSKMNSSPLSSIFPFISFDLTSDKGILYGVNLHNSSLVLFDRFSLENYNSITFAKSGAGKSFFSKLEILRTLMFDVDVIVMDPPPALGAISLSVLRAANALVVPVPPTVMDFSSTAAFLSMLDETIEQLAERGLAPELQFLRFVGSKVDENKSMQKELLNLMRTLFGHALVRTPLKDSAEFDNATARLMTVYELDGPATSSQVRNRCLAYLDGVNQEIEVDVRSTWPSHQARLRREALA